MRFFVLFLLSTLLLLPVHSETICDYGDILEKYLFTILEESPESTIIFASELNISNGDPYIRNFGERGMFGKLVTSDTVCKDMEDYLESSDDILYEVKRLLVGPFTNGGDTEFNYKTLGKGKYLDLSTGKWIRSNGSICIRIRHTTEYYNKIRYAYLIQLPDTTLTIYRPD